jgi:ABC-type phosphate transport system substrate-binding protein
MANTPRFHRRVCLATGSGLLLSTLLDTQLSMAGPEELAVIVHSSNTARLSLPEIAAIFKTTMRYWSGSKRIMAFNLPARSSERVLFDRVILGWDPDAALRFWIDRKIRGGEPPPRSVPEPQLVLRIVQQAENAIGYVPSHLVKTGVRVIARVRHNEAELTTSLIASGGL